MKKLKKIIAISICGAGILLWCGCSKSFLNKLPQDEISDAVYWTQPSDLQLYVNQFYTVFPSYGGFDGGIFWKDNNSDNLLPGIYDTRLAGVNTLQSNNGNWTYTNIRGVNYGLEHYKQIGGNFDNIKTWVGELYFFRAYCYFDLVKSYGDVPWIGHTLNIDSDDLFNTRTPRQQVVDSILSDLDQAISYLAPKATAEANRLNKECAQLFKSRVALYEGTWEKYHQNTDFGVSGSDGAKYLQLAAEASQALIDGSTVQIYRNGNTHEDYGHLFNQNDLSDISEILLWKKYDASLGLYHNSQLYLPNTGGNTGLTRSLVNDYLCADGNPIGVSHEYQGDQTLLKVVANRDPRLSQTMWAPGDTMELNGTEVVRLFSKPTLDLVGEYLCTTGYQLKKGASIYSQDGQHASNTSITASIVFRYAEALLNYAEAKAELGSITQADLDKTINVLRDRVGMPHLQLSTITHDPNWLFPSLSPIINEIRRERRVELACEGYRFDDLMRWAAASLIKGKRPLGAIFDPSQFPTLVVGQNVLVNGQGYIDPYQTIMPSGWGFHEDRDYLLPVPQNEITLNKDLAQNPGW